MGSYFSERWDAITGLPAAFAENPWFFIIAFAIGLPLIWWKWRVSGRSIQTAIENQTHGLRADADEKQMRHETGIGTRGVLVMRPAKTPKMIYFGLIFFGGGAVFYALVVLQSPPVELKDWGTFAVCSAFVVGAMALIELNFTRVIVSDDAVEKRRVLYRKQVIPFSHIERIEPASKTFVGGMMIHSREGDKMRILAAMSGYRQLIDRLAPYDQQMSMLSKLQKARKNA